MRSGRRSLIVCQSHHIALLCFQGARRRFGRPHYFITGFGFCKPPRRFFVNFFVHPEGTLTFPRATSLSYHVFPYLQAASAIFFAARPAGRPGCLRFRHVRPLPFPALADNEPAVTSLRKRSVRPTRRGSEKSHRSAARGWARRRPARGGWRRGQNSPSSGLAATGCFRMSYQFLMNTPLLYPAFGGCQAGTDDFFVRIPRISGNGAENPASGRISPLPFPLPPPLFRLASLNGIRPARAQSEPAAERRRGGSGHHGPAGAAA